VSTVQVQTPRGDPGHRQALAAALAEGGLRTDFQPVVDLATGTVVAYEALARGPEGPLVRPDALVAAARAAGLLPELDQACRAAALRGAVRAGLLDPLMLFVPVEPEVLNATPLETLTALAEEAPPGLRVVLEITERAMASRPADLLRAVHRVRRLGWRVALADVGAEPASLTLLSLLEPDVVKLDVSLVQERPSPAVAEVVHAVNAYAERSGALVLAEGVTDEQQLATALALGATLGQGWLFGCPTPAPRPVPGPVSRRLSPAPLSAATPASPFAALPASTPLRRSTKALLVEVSLHLERHAAALGRLCLVGSTFQDSSHFTPATAERYAELARRAGLVCAFGRGLPDEPAPGVRGGPLAADDPLAAEWDVAVLSPHFSAALLARDLSGPAAPESERAFEYALTYDRDVVVQAAQALLLKVSPVPATAARLR